LFEGGQQRDCVRDDFLESKGYRVVRIAGYDVLREPSLCLKTIEEEVTKRMRELENPSPRPLSARRGEGRRRERKREFSQGRQLAASFAL